VAYPVGIAALFADSDLDLPDEGQPARVDAAATVAGAPRPDAQIVLIILRHEPEIED
jgi:hypothetical protein